MWINPVFTAACVGVAVAAVSGGYIGSAIWMTNAALLSEHLRRMTR